MDVTINDVHFAYSSAPVLKGVGFEAHSSEMVGIIGPNGSGKTTLLKCINRILAPSQGYVAVDSVDICNMKRNDLAKIMSYVPQNSTSDISSPTVYEVVMMGRKPHGSWQMNSDDEEKVWKAMEDMSVDDLAVKYFTELSSGQTQRVLLARALAQEASFLLLDEPTSNLDIKYQRDVMEVVSDLVCTRGVGVFAIIHDMDLALRYCDKIILMQDGIITASGNALEVISPENIRQVYDVDIAIDYNYGRPHVIML